MRDANIYINTCITDDNELYNTTCYVVCIKISKSVCFWRENSGKINVKWQVRQDHPDMSAVVKHHFGDLRTPVFPIQTLLNI